MIFHVSGDHALCHVNGKPCNVHGQQAVCVSPWQPHDFGFGGAGGRTVSLVLYLDPGWIQQVMGNPVNSFQFGRSAVSLSTQTADRIGRIVELLSDAENDFDLEHELSALMQACYERSWHGMNVTAVPMGRHSISRDHRIRKTIMLMKERVAATINLDEIASEAGLSRPHFYRLFRENVGITPNVYLNTLRMELAIEKLVTTDQAVTSIGLDLGFASQASFTRFFGANVGIPPTDYRRVAHCS